MKSRDSGPAGSLGSDWVGEIGELDIHFFFVSGSETAASAFLATLLEQDDTFRLAFFGEVAPELRVDRTTHVTVEVERTLMKGRVDLLLELDGAVICVENKLNAGAKLDGQLLRYYESCRMEWPERRVVAVYLAPEEEFGTPQINEVNGLIVASHREDLDKARHLEWRTVDKAIGLIAAGKTSFALNAMRTILKEIEDAKWRVNRDWTTEELKQAARDVSPDAGEIVGRVVAWAELTERTLRTGHGKAGNLYVTFRSTIEDELRVVRVADAGAAEIYYATLMSAKPFDDPAKMRELVARLRQVPGAKSPKLDDAIFERQRSSYLMADVLSVPVAMDAFLRVLDWIGGELSAANDAERALA